MRDGWTGSGVCNDSMTLLDTQSITLRCISTEVYNQFDLYWLLITLILVERHWTLDLVQISIYLKGEPRISSNSIDFEYKKRKFVSYTDYHHGRSLRTQNIHTSKH
jgi:hypothetical protein